MVRGVNLTFRRILALVSSGELDLTVIRGVAKIGSWARVVNCAVVAEIGAGSVASGDITLNLVANVCVVIHGLALE